MLPVVVAPLAGLVAVAPVLLLAAAPVLLLAAAPVLLLAAGDERVVSEFELLVEPLVRLE